MKELSKKEADDTFQKYVIQDEDALKAELDELRKNKDKTSLELIQYIVKLENEVEGLRSRSRWYEDTRRVNDAFDTAAANWNSITITGRVDSRSEYAFYIQQGNDLKDLYFRIESENNFEDGDTVMIFGQIRDLNAHDEDDRNNGSMGVDNIVIVPDRMVLMSHADNKIIMNIKKG